MNDERTTRLELRLDLLQEQVDAQQMVLAWLLSTRPDDALSFLRTQANEFEQGDPKKFEAWISVLDDLIEDVEYLRGRRDPVPDTSR